MVVGVELVTNVVLENDSRCSSRTGIAGLITADEVIRRGGSRFAFIAA